MRPIAQVEARLIETDIKGGALLLFVTVRFLSLSLVL